MKLTKIVVLTFALVTSFARPGQTQADQSAPAPTTPRIAIVPLGNRDGTPGALDKVSTGLHLMLEQRNLRVLEGDTVKKAYEQVIGETPGTTDRFLTMDEKSLLKIGQALDVDYVIAANLKWHTKTIYVFPSTRRKADCTADVMIIDIKRGEVVLSKHGLRRDSENKNLGGAMAAILWAPAAGIFGAGPKTPPQAAAGVAVLNAALEDFMGAKTGPHKIETKQDNKK